MNIPAWLKEQKVAAAAYDADRLLAAFLDEMERGLDGESSSLAMIPAFIGTETDLPRDKPVAVIDAGGTNLRICIAQLDSKGEIHLSHFSNQPMPGRDREVDAAAFYQPMTDALVPLADQFDSIGFCFSYPASIQPNHDGRLLHWTKEIKIPELVGRHIGEGLINAFDACGVHGKNVAILNDTVACLLAALAEGKRFNASSYVGFILGTGTNTSYVEKNENIVKLDGFIGSGSQVINVESGGFSFFDRGEIDLEFDRQSENPGKHCFEKYISGVYMGDLTLALLQALIPKGVLSDAGAASLSVMNELSTIHIDNLVAENGRDTGVLLTEAFTDADRAIMKTVFEGVVDRAAFLAAVNILAAVVKTGQGHDPERPVCVNIDGSTYYKTHRMAEKVQDYLGPMLEKRGVHIRCIHVDNAPVMGAAIAGLTAFR